MDMLFREEGRAFLNFDTCVLHRQENVTCNGQKVSKVKPNFEFTLFSFPIKKEQFSPWFFPWSLELGKDFCSLFGENEIKMTCFWDFQTFKRERQN